MNMMFYEIIEERFQILGFDRYFFPLSFPEKEIRVSSSSRLGIGKEGVEMSSVWGVRKEQMNAPA